MQRKILFILILIIGLFLLLGCDEPICGDGICAQTENQYNCSHDCGIPETHFECVKDSCTEVNGAGINSCYSDEECLVQESNVKNLEYYAEKQVFLVSDSDWREVIPWVPVSVWDNKSNSVCNQGYGLENVCAYPFLVYHQENNAIDIDSIIYFLDSYHPTNIITIGNTNPELFDFLKTRYGENNISPKHMGPDYLDYWTTSNKIVYSKGDYTTSLMASTYASLNNAPLIIEGNELDYEKTFSTKEVTCIGIDKSFCNTVMPIDDVRENYFLKTKSNKLLLTDPRDINKSVDESFIQEYLSNTGSINNLYTKDSIMAAYLASAKKEILLFDETNSLENINQLVKENANKYNSEYLTIVSNPDNIPNSKSIPNGNEIFYADADNFNYGNINNDPLIELSVGRLFALGPSDLSAQISRTLFYNQLENSSEYALFQFPGNYFRLNRENLTKEYLETQGFTGTSEIINPNNQKSFDINHLVDKQFIIYSGHGGTEGWGLGIDTYKIRENNTHFDSSLVISQACLTSSYGHVKEHQGQKNILFPINVIRRGAIATIGATDFSNDGQFDEALYLHNIFSNKTLGEGMKNTLNLMLLNRATYFDFNTDGFVFTLFGDPTFNYNLDELPTRSIKKTIVDYPNSKEIVLEIPSSQVYEFFPYSQPSGYYMQLAPSNEIVNQHTVYFNLRKTDNNTNWDTATGTNNFNSLKNMIIDLGLSKRTINNVEASFEFENGEISIQIFDKNIDFSNGIYTKIIDDKNQYLFLLHNIH